MNASGAAAPIVHMAWQSVENGFKTLSVGHNIPQTHDIGQLMDHLRDNNLLGLDDISQLSRDAAIISGSRTYNATRYPESGPGYWSSRPREEIADVVLAAERIYHLVEVKVAHISRNGSIEYKPYPIR